MANTSRQKRDRQKVRRESEGPRRLNLFCIGQLESLLGATRDELKSAARDQTSLYNAGLIIKPALPFAKKHPIGKTRNLDKPVKQLSRIQKEIYRNLLAPLELPSYIKGGVRGESTVANLKFHRRDGSLVT